MEHALCGFQGCCLERRGLLSGIGVLEGSWVDKSRVLSALNRSYL